MDLNLPVQDGFLTQLGPYYHFRDVRGFLCPEPVPGNPILADSWSSVVMACNSNDLTYPAMFAFRITSPDTVSRSVNEDIFL